MKILGVDPSTTRTGYALIEDEKLLFYGSVAPKSTLSSPHKLLTIYDRIYKIVAEHKPDVIICEDQFQKFANAVKAISKVRGLIELVAGQHDIEFKYIEPKKAKKLFTGDGNATKKDMINWAILQYNISTDINNDEADAIGIASAYFKEAI